MEPIYEITKIKQVLIEIQNEFKERLLNPEDVVQIAYYLIGDDDREVFLVLCLNTQLQVIAAHRCHVGSLTSTIVSPREIFKASILNNACGIILAHNHPSMNLEPSQEDFELTNTIIKAGLVLDIPLLDHIIINTKGDYVSFKEQGYIK